MPLMQTTIVHVVAADAPRDRLRRLHAALAAYVPQAVVYVGPRAATDLTGTHVHAPLRALRAGSLQRQIARVAARDNAATVVLHAWSPAAAEWCLPLAAGNRPVLIELEPPADERAVAAWSRSHTFGCVVQSAAQQAHLQAAGVPSPRCVVIEALESVEPHAAPDVAALRERLSLVGGERAIVTLPPIERCTGAFYATWAALVLEKVRHDIRLLVPARGGDVGRIRQLVQSCRHEFMVRFVPPDVTLGDLLAVADVATFLPPVDAPLGGLGAALGAGRAVVATDAPSIRERVAGRAGVWLCRPRDPEDAARQMLAALEAPPAAAGDQLVGSRTIAQIVANYLSIYANLAARRPAACSAAAPAGH
jgi:hypothetical protein